jgi:hypothetical protein
MMKYHHTYIYAATSRDSLQVFQFRQPVPPSTNPLQLVFTDSRARPSLDCLSVGLSLQEEGINSMNIPASYDKSIALLSDKLGFVVGFPTLESETGNEKISYGSSAIFEARLDRCITRLRILKHQIPWQQQYIGYVVSEEAVGISSDGAIVSFRIVSSKAWAILKFLEIISTIASLQTEAELAGRIKSLHEEATISNLLRILRSIEVESSQNLVQLGILKPKDYHIDGNKLARIVRSRDNRKIEALLQAAKVDQELLQKWQDMCSIFISDKDRNVEAIEQSSKVFEWLDKLLLPGQT